MSILFLIFFYTFPASLIFVYGMGLERLSMNARSKNAVLSFMVKNSILMLVSASLVWLLIVYVLSPAGLSVLIPFFSLIIIYLCEEILTLIFPRTAQKQMRERLFTCGTLVFALHHAFGYIELLLIVISACLSMMIWSSILYAIKFRVDESKMSAQWKNAPLLLISMGMIALALYAWDGAWLLSACNF